MTYTNFQRAYDIISEGIANEEHPGDITQRLLKQFLLVPDLPEPQLGCTNNEVPYINFEAKWWRVNAMQGEDAILIYARTPTIPTDPQEAEHLALALLAAIKWHKENQ